jgi:transposase-like protein
MPKNRNRYTTKFKFQVALEAAKGLKTINQLASEHSIHPNLVSQWKRHLLADGNRIFDSSDKHLFEQQAREAELFEQIGRLKMELEWLKKKAASFG